MLDEWLLWVLRRFGRLPPAPDGGHARVNLTRIDSRLDQLEHTLPEIEARIRMLETQARLRGRASE